MAIITWSHARGGRIADDLVENRDHHVQAFERKPRLAGKRAMEKPLEHFDLRDAREELTRVDGIVGRAELTGFHCLPKPDALLRYEHMVVVVPRRGAVNRAQAFDRLERVTGTDAAGPATIDAGRRASVSLVRPCDCGNSDGSPMGSVNPSGSSRAAR